MNLTRTQVEVVKQAAHALESTRTFILCRSSSHDDACRLFRAREVSCDCYVSLVPDAANGLAKLLRQIAGRVTP